MRGTSESILRWLAGIKGILRKPIRYFSRSELPAPDVAVQTRADGASGEAEAGATATESSVPTPNATATFATAVAADAKIDQEASVSHVAPIPTDEQEVQRRRTLVRTLFNDFWSERDDKPAAFVDRLDQAETFLNDRLAARGEPWQLDGESRKVLGLPPRSDSRGKANGAARPI